MGQGRVTWDLSAVRSHSLSSSLEVIFEELATQRDFTVTDLARIFESGYLLYLQTSGVSVLCFFLLKKLLAAVC